MGKKTSYSLVWSGDHLKLEGTNQRVEPTPVWLSGRHDYEMSVDMDHAAKDNEAIDELVSSRVPDNANAMAVNMVTFSQTKTGEGF